MENKTTFAKTDKAPKAMRGQAALVYEALTNEGQTVAQITETIVAGGLVTRQDPERIAAYYLCIFKKQGLVTATRPVATTDVPEGAEVVNKNDEGIDPSASEDEMADEIAG